MAQSITSRFGFKKQSAGTDAWPGRAGVMEILDQIETLGAQALEGTYVARPAAGKNGRFYFVEGGGILEGTLFYDNGTAWTTVMRMNPGSGQPGSEPAYALGWNTSDDNRGSSVYAAHADHSHPYSFGYVRNRFPLMWGTGIGPGVFATTAEYQQRVERGDVTAEGAESQLLQVGRAGVYRIRAGFHLEGFSEPASPWKTDAMQLAISKGPSPSDIAQVIYASPIPAIVAPGIRNIREHSIEWEAQLAADDYIACVVLLAANVATSSGIVTNGFKHISVEFI